MDTREKRRETARVALPVWPTLAEWRRLLRKSKGPAEKERVVSVPQNEQLASTPGPPLRKGKKIEPSV